jgi:hypothetical protein
MSYAGDLSAVEFDALLDQAGGRERRTSTSARELPGIREEIDWDKLAGFLVRSNAR